MKKLLLFDIDGTLSTGGGENRFVRAINNIHELGISSTKDFSGYTDYLILAALLEDEGWDDTRIKQAMPKLLQEVDRVHKETFRPENLRLLPGIEQLLAALHNADTTLGLITGNLEPIAHRKLEALHIWQYFSVGGFGSDPHTERSDLVLYAIKRAGYAENLETYL